MAPGSPSQRWHLGPVTADGADRRSAGGCSTQSRSLRIKKRQEAEETVCLSCSPGCLGDKSRASISITVTIWHLLPALKFTAMDEGGRKENKGGARQTIKHSHNIFGSGIVQLENILKSIEG
jgi:hypothetical protein